jgi:hypothetical protein
VPLPDGYSVCSDPCVAERRMEDDLGRVYVCVDGIPVECSSVAYGSHCSACGCNPGEYCGLESSPGCHPEIAVGQPCEQDWMCQSDNCDLDPTTSVRECMVPVGSACTADNCGTCLGGGIFCSRHCGDDATPYYSCDSQYDCAGYSGDWHCVPDCAVGRCDVDGYGCSANDSVCPATMPCTRLVWTNSLGITVTSGYACLEPH